MKDQIETIRKVLHKHSLDAMLISSYEAIRYLSTFSGFIPHERGAYILITKTNSTLFTNSIYITAVIKHVKTMQIAEYSADHPLRTLLKEIMRNESISRIGFEPDDITVSEWGDFTKYLKTLVPISLANVREHKNGDELESLQKACTVADKALQAILPMIQTGITERAIQIRLEDAMRLQIADVAFPTIVAFGENAASPHHLSSLRKLKKNDLILIDFGARVHGYNSDMTRTFFFGPPPQELRRMYEAVLASQQAAVTSIEKSLQENVPIIASEVDRVAREYLLKGGYPSIPHSLGHGIGLKVHESPSLSPSSNDILTEGMVFSIEPGVYSPGKSGIRIEDLYTISGTTLHKMTHFPSTLTVLKP